MAKSTNTGPAPKVHKDLEGFEMRVNAFGEITTTFQIEKLNAFLNNNVEDKKLKGIDIPAEVKEFA